MMHRDIPYMDNWDRDYRVRGQLWGGTPAPLPDLPPGSRLLELGCGNGKNLHGMTGKGWEIIAMDCSVTALRLCLPIIEGTADADLVTGDAINLPFRDAVFDTVFSLHVTGHLKEPDRRRSATEMFRVLKPGGQVVFRDFSVGDFRFGKGEIVEPGTFWRGTGLCTHYFEPDEVTGLFGSFQCVTMGEHRWTMRIKGKEYPRSEIEALFVKER